MQKIAPHSITASQHLSIKHHSVTASHLSGVNFCLVLDGRADMMKTAFLLVMLCARQCLVQSRDIYVDAASTNLVQTCTGLNVATACPTIESGALLARSNDTILIEPGELVDKLAYTMFMDVLFHLGLYTGPGNEGLSFGNNSQTIVGVTLKGNLNSGTNTDVRITCSGDNRFLTTFNDFFVQLSDFSIDGCRVSGATGANNVNVGGGGMEIIRSSAISIVNVAFTNNTARYGGGLLVQESSSVVISECSFVNNIAVYWGGGLKTYSSGVTIRSSVFLTNSCDGSRIDDSYFNFNTENVGGGGAVHANQGSNLAVISSQFVGNFALVMSGAVCVSTMGSASFEDVVFDGNIVHGGDNCFNNANCRIRAGALLVSNTVTSINDSNFTNNVAITSDISMVRLVFVELMCLKMFPCGCVVILCLFCLSC